MLSCAVVCGMANVYFGAVLLLNADTHTLRLVAGLFFGTLSVCQITVAAWTALLKRAKARHDEVNPSHSAGPSTPSLELATLEGSSRIAQGTAATHSPRPTPLPATPAPTVVTHNPGQTDVSLFKQPEHLQISDSDVLLPGAKSTADITINCESDILSRPARILVGDMEPSAVLPPSGPHDESEEIHEHSSLTGVRHPHMVPEDVPSQWERWKSLLWPRLSERASPAGMLVLLCAASIIGGLLAGILGAGGPPFMTAYAFLRLDKDILLGFSAVPAAFMFLRLSLYVFGDGSVFTLADWPAYLGVLCASLVGVLVGTRLRRHIDSEALVRVLHCLVFLSSALMLGAMTDLVVAEAYGAVILTGVALLVIGVLWPACILALAHVAACRQ